MGVEYAGWLPVADRFVMAGVNAALAFAQTAAPDPSAKQLFGSVFRCEIASFFGIVPLANPRMVYNSRMKLSKSGFLLVLACICLATLTSATASNKIPPELIGTWDYTSLAVLKKGKPFGTVHFQPGQWTVTFNPDATWTMKTPQRNSFTGSYEVHGHDLDMKLADGKPYDKYRFTLKQDWKVLVLTTNENTISASRE